MAKTTVKKKAARPRRDALLDAAAKERRRMRTLVNAKREIARLALQLRGAERRAHAALLLLATDIVEAEVSRRPAVQAPLTTLEELDRQDAEALRAFTGGTGAKAEPKAPKDGV